MYHSVIFEDLNGVRINTWDDWHIVPVSRPVISVPAIKTRTVDIPGGMGGIDLTDTLTGFPLYDNRTGDLEFIVVNDYSELVKTHEEWFAIYSKIMKYLHGKRLKMFLEDDPDYYYAGRFSVNEWKSNSYYSTVVISYDVEPYKWYKQNATVSLDATTTEHWSKLNTDLSHLGDAPVSPIVSIGSSYTDKTTQKIYVTFENVNLPKKTVTQTFYGGALPEYAYRFVIFGSTCKLTYRTSVGTAVIGLEYKRGYL